MIRETIHVEHFQDHLIFCHFPIITVFHSPDDFPGKYVARLFNMHEPTAYAIIKDTLEEVRQAIPEYMRRTRRSPMDYQAIVEIWF